MSFSNDSVSVSNKFPYPAINRVVFVVGFVRRG